MMAASAPEKGPPSPAEPPWDIKEAASGDATDDARWRTEPPAAAPAAGKPAPPGDCGEFGRTLAIMGDAEPMEPRLESPALLRRRRMMKKARMPPATRARNPRTTITAMAQWGKFEASPVAWMPPGFEPGVDRVEDADADDAEAAEADAAAAAADELAAIEELTESSTVVSANTTELHCRLLTCNRIILTDCSKGSLWYFRAIEPLAAWCEDPVEWHRYILPIPLKPFGAEPCVIDKCSYFPRLVGWIVDLREMQYRLQGIGIEDVNVDQICWCDLGTSTIPCMMKHMTNEKH